MHDIISNLKTLKYLGHIQTMHAFVAEATTKVDRQCPKYHVLQAGFGSYCFNKIQSFIITKYMTHHTVGHLQGCIA
jgi:hypothetical protein